MITPLKLAILFLCLVTATSANTCKTFYGFSLEQNLTGIARIKQMILTAAQHPHFQTYKITADSKGELVSFLNPLIEHIFEKSLRIFKEEPLSEASEKMFLDYQKDVMDRLNSGELTYSQILTIPEIVSRFMEDREEKFTNNKYTRWAEEETRAKVLDFTNKGVYPIPIFLSPDFELRTQLWSLATPPISIVKKWFHSYLDQRGYSPNPNIEHDWGHAEILLRGISNTEQREVTKKIQKRFLDYANQLPTGQKEFTLFSLHTMFPESGLTISQTVDAKPHLNFADFISYVGNILERPQFFKYHWHLPWILSGLHLSNVRFETLSGKLIRYEVKGSIGEFKEGAHDDLVKFIKDLNVQLTKDFAAIIETEFAVQKK